jgi:hypothetical protein
VIREENSIFLEVIVSVILRKIVHFNACLTLNGYGDGALGICRPNSVRFLLVGFAEE